MEIDDHLIATICVIQMAMNVSTVYQWERNGMTLSHKTLMRYRLLDVRLGTKKNDSFPWM